MTNTSSTKYHFLSFLPSKFSDKSAIKSRQAFFRLHDRFLQSSITPGVDDALDWDEITDDILEQHFYGSRAFFLREMYTRQVKKGEIIPVWVTGRKYEDLVNIFSASLAGFVPRVISMLYPVTSVAQMLSSSDNSAGVIVCDPAAIQLAQDSSVFEGKGYTFLELPDFSKFPPLNPNASIFDDFPSVSSQDAALIYHSSGTTSIGAPKAITLSHALLLNSAQNKMPSCIFQGRFTGQDIINTFADMAMIASCMTFLAALARDACIVHAPHFRQITSQEVMLMIDRFKLNRLSLFGNDLAKHLRATKSDTAFEEALKAMRQISYSSVSLGGEDELYYRKRGFPLTSFYGSTEIGPQLTSVLGSDENDLLLRKAAGATVEFHIPEAMEVESSQAQLYEVVLPSTSFEAPHAFIEQDGLYHTNDVFDQPAPGLYRWRGRTGDFIKQTIGDPGFLNARYIEETAQSLCVGLITGAAVVATRSGLPCLVIEARADGDLAEEDLKQRVLERIADFNSRLMGHEKFEDPRLLLVVGEGSIPRNKLKGNVRRPAAAEKFRSELDSLERRFLESR